MSVTAAVTPTADSISVDRLRTELDEINRSILDLLEKGKSVLEDSTASITQAAFDAGKLIVYRTEVPPQASGDGAMIPAQPARWDALTADEFTKLRARLDLLQKLVNLLDKPLGSVTFSYAQLIRESGTRWKALQ